MYLPRPRQRPSAEDAAAAAIMFGGMFNRCTDISEADGPDAFAPVLYDLAYVFWEVGAFVAGEPLPRGTRLELVSVIRAAHDGFFQRFPTLFPEQKVQLAFDGLYHLALGPDPDPELPPSRLENGAVRNAHARADWLRNALHNVYLEHHHFPRSRNVIPFPKPHRPGLFD